VDNKIRIVVSSEDFARVQETFDGLARVIPELAALAAEPSPFIDR